MANRKLVDAHKLSSEEFQILNKASKDIFFFALFIYLIHPVRGKVPFLLYPFQKSLLYEFLKNPFNVVLKFRQAGVTELISMFCLWFAMFHPHKNIVIISIKDRVAKKVLRKIKFMYKNLPVYLRTRIVNGRSEDSYGTACVTLDTVIIGEYQNFQIGEIIPAIKGILDVNHLNLRVLTHDGTFERVTKTINKGKLETWEIQNNKGKILKCTPNHRLYTTKGWKTVKEIKENNLTCIFQDNDYLKDIVTPITIKPKKEIIKETKYKGYFISNWGRVFSNKSGELKLMKTRLMGHERVRFIINKKHKFISVHRLEWETFNCEIPKGFIVDHIDCVRTHNYLTNLQCITLSENTKRAYKYNRCLASNNYRLTSIDLLTLGKLKKWHDKLGKDYGNGKIIADKLNLTTKEVSRYINEEAGKNIYVSKIKVNKITEEIICDLEVENSHSYITESHFINHNTEMEFANGSIISSIPTTEDAGRSEAVSLLVIDEAAIVRWAERIWAASWPTLSTGGRAIVNSTAYGVGNFFHKLFTDASAGGNVFNAIRLKWKMHPERYRFDGDMEWYNKQKDILGPRKTAQEIDGDFLTSGNTVFDLSDIKDIEEYIDDEIKPVKTAYKGLLKVYKEPIRGERYFLGMDVATGRSNDFTTMSILNKRGEEYVSFKGKIPVDKARDMAGSYGKKYNNALSAPESNDIGLAVAHGLQENGYSNLYYHKKLLRKKYEPKPEQEEIPGWYTTKANRPLIIDKLEEDVRNNTIDIKDKFFCQETYTFIYDSRNRPIALNKDKKAREDIFDETVYTDDAIFGKAIANWIREEPINKTTLPR